MKRNKGMVDNLYTQHETLDPFLLAEKLNIEYEYVPFLRNPEGQFLTIDEQPLILLNERLREQNRRYYIMAHELYHAIAHSNLAGYYVLTNQTKGKLENEANLFALYLLYSCYEKEEGTEPRSIYDLYYRFGIDLNIIDELT